MAQTRSRKPEPARGEVLVAILKDRADLTILREQGWYRVPVRSAPKRWPPQWLAFYQPKVFGEEAYAVRHFGRVSRIRKVPRRQLFPNELPNPKSDLAYYQVYLTDLQALPQPIFSRRFRRIIFIPTTWAKFTAAVEINDLFDESPLEDALWAMLKRFSVSAERQWLLQLGVQYYLLDFAVFCHEGQLDIETDGDTYHLDKESAARDNERNNALASGGWKVLRFTSQQIREQGVEYCIPKVMDTVNRLGGLDEEALTPRVFYHTSGEMGHQLSLFEGDFEQDMDLD